jgi:hypothetical protein
LIFVCYHTGGNYERHAAELVESALPFGVAVDLWQRPCSGSWVENCAQKADFVLCCLEHYRQPIVYLDADARVRKSPQMLLNMPPEVDIAFHRLDKVELISATMYFSGSDDCYDVVRDWKKRCVDQPHVWDQKHLDASVQAIQPNVCELPETYCRIFDRWKRMAREDIVIEQMQASRQNRF